MNTTPKRFDNAIAALVKGYLKGTLAKGNCQACAVGNMVAGSLGLTIHEHSIGKRHGYSWDHMRTARWDDVFCSSIDGQEIDATKYVGRAKEEIDATGYSWAELAKVELAFEQATTIQCGKYSSHTPDQIDADQLAGLHAVVQVLCDIEGITDPAPYKAQFDKSLPLADIIVG